VPELTVGFTSSEGWLWLSGSLFVAILWTNLAWIFRPPRSGAIGEFVTRLASWPFSPWLLQFLRMLYYLGVPFAALLWGHETLGVGAWTLLALGWWAYRRALTAIGEGNAVTGADSSGWVLLREAAHHEAHWAFYRNVPVLAAGAYWGAWVGLALVALEAALNPAWRKGLANPWQAPAQLMRGALGVVSVALFLLTQNLWLALAVHWGISWGLAVLARALPLLPGVKRET